MKTLRVRPVLVETSEKSRICHLTQNAKDENWPIAIDEIEVPIILDSINYDIVLISLDDRDFKEGDNVYSDVLDEIFELTNCELIDDLNNGIYSGIYKVIANQRQFSDELTEKLVEEYNNGGMKDFEIEMNDVTIEKSQYINDIINIISNSELVGSFHSEQRDECPIIVQSLVDKKAETNNTIDLDAYANGAQDCFNAINELGIYTEADVVKLLTDFKNHIGILRGIQVLDSDINKFMETKKK